MLSQESLTTFPDEAIPDRTEGERWRPLRLCGRTFAFDETGVVSAMFAPSEVKAASAFNVALGSSAPRP